MYSDAGRPKKSREDKQRELFLQKRSRKGLNKGKEMKLPSGFCFRDVPKPPTLYPKLWNQVPSLKHFVVQNSGDFSVENIARLDVFMFQTSDNSQLCMDSQYSSQ